MQSHLQHGHSFLVTQLAILVIVPPTFTLQVQAEPSNRVFFLPLLHLGEGRGNMEKEGTVGDYIGHPLPWRREHVEWAELWSRAHRIVGLRRPAESCFSETREVLSDEAPPILFCGLGCDL